MSDNRSSHMLEKVGIDYQDRRTNKRGHNGINFC